MVGKTGIALGHLIIYKKNRLRSYYYCNDIKIAIPIQEFRYNTFRTITLRPILS